MVSFLTVTSISMLGAAQGEPPRASLIVTRGEGAQGCPDAAMLASQVRSVAGADVLSTGVGTSPVETWVHVAVKRNFGGYSALISTSGSRAGSRLLEDLGPSCASLADAIAVTIAIFLDPYAHAPPPVPARPVASPRIAEPKVKPVSSARPLRRWFMDGSGGIAFDFLAHAQPLLAADVGFQLSPRWSVALGGAWLPSDTQQSPGGEVELNLAYGYALGCGRALGDDDGARLDWCVAPLLGSLRGEGRGYTTAFSKSSTWLAIAVGPRVAFPFTRALSWVLTAQGLATLTQNAFDVRDQGNVSRAFQSSAVAGQTSLGLRGQL